MFKLSEVKTEGNEGLKIGEPGFDAPEGVKILSGRSIEKPLNNLVGSKAETEFTIYTCDFDGAKLELIVDVSLAGRHSTGQVKVVLMREAGEGCCES